jgi:hypothetical protein
MAKNISDRDTGEERTITVQADGEQTAASIANEHGTLASIVRPCDLAGTLKSSWRFGSPFHYQIPHITIRKPSAGSLRSHVGFDLDDESVRVERVASVPRRKWVSRCDRRISEG